MRKGSRVRAANGATSLFIVVFFLVHGALGSAALLVGFASPLSALVWLGVAAIGIHIALSIATSYEQLADRERPPSPRKKRHLALKWASGIIVGIAAYAHVALPGRGGPAGGVSAVGAAAAIVLVAALAAHACIGARSLIKDLGLSKNLKGTFRAIVCACAAGIACAAIVAMFRGT